MRMNEIEVERADAIELIMLVNIVWYGSSVNVIL